MYILLIIYLHVQWGSQRTSVIEFFKNILGKQFLACINRQLLNNVYHNIIYLRLTIYFFLLLLILSLAAATMAISCLYKGGGLRLDWNTCVYVGKGLVTPAGACNSDHVSQPPRNAKLHNIIIRTDYYTLNNTRDR